VKRHQPGKSAGRMLGAALTGDRCDFRVWAPWPEKVTLLLLPSAARGTPAVDLAMAPGKDDILSVRARARAGDRYFLIAGNNKPVPDPVSRFLPEGVHGPTEIVNPASFAWSDVAWRGLPLNDYIIYELHVGTFTPEGTFAGAIAKLPYLKRLGITVIELMPVAAFPGMRNWGYDGVSPYAVQASYGGPEGLRRFVDAAHALELGVMLDVVYNHLGNEGNYLRQFGPYFTDRHKTPWGDAINYDQECCQQVREFVIQNALYWIREYHMDGLRLDAVQTILDDSPTHILAEIGDEVARLGRTLGREVCVIAETDQNAAKLVRPRDRGGYGLSALWSDDFHHAVHAFFTGERQGYYQDFGEPEQIVRALNEGFVFQGQPARYWNGHPRGTPARDVPPQAHVICVQNHDQVGNRPQGERLSVLIPRGARMLASALLLLSPHTPLLFMGEEYDETNPFLFFTDFGDAALRKAVSQGRHNEFKDFGHPVESVPDPQYRETFERSKLNWQRADPGNRMLAWYRSLLDLRKKYVTGSERNCKAELKDGVISMQAPADQPKIKVFARIQGNAVLPEPGSGWKRELEQASDGFAVAVDVLADKPD
jgi:maltooligosyltrehalose trehalohydrolase